jgi:streptogramin lyase
MFAQTKTTNRNWKEYFSFYETKQIEQYGNIAVALSENGLFFYNTETEKITKLTKLQGLSSVGLTGMAFDEQGERIFIGYANGMIDVVQLPSLSITPIGDIYQKTTYNSKVINTIQIHNSIAYLSTDFGLVCFDVKKMRFTHTTVFGAQGESVAVNQTCVDEQTQTLYAATNNGIFSIALSKNLSDNTLWTHETEFVYGTEKVTNIITFAGNVYYVPELAEGVRDTVFVRTENETVKFCSLKHINTLRVANEQLCVLANQEIAIYAENQECVKTIVATDLSQIQMGYNGFYDIQWINNTIWLADSFHGLTNFNEKKTIIPKGPYSNRVADVAFNNNRLYIACGNSNEWKAGTIHVVQGDFWAGHRNWEVTNSLTLYVPTGGTTYYYGTTNGVVQSSSPWGYDTIYNKYNTNGALDPLPYRINKITSDKKNNIWILNHYTSKPLAVKTADDAWFSFSLKGNFESSDILIDRDNNKWIAGNAQLVVFNERGTMDNTTDDKFVLVPLVEKGDAIAGKSSCLAIDIKGEMWIGTIQGIAVLANPTQVFNGNAVLTRPQITIDGELGYLLSSERISCIFVDGGNRKWIGTENSGVYLISGTTPLKQLQHFHVDNSPLPSNTISAITINQTTGEVFFATNNGLVSFLSDATLGVAEQEEVLIYPNPVRETYTGDIRIQQLTANAHVHITDMDGNVVFSTIANGGTAVWNGYNLRGERAATGVYFVYVSNDDGSQTRVGRLVFIK